MTFYNIKDYFKFSREQRTGIVLLFGIIIILQLVYFFVEFNTIEKEYPDKQKWLSLQSEVDNARMHDLNDNPKM
ncbi:MAG TPA: hypothetical protein VJU52_13385, partial [Flavobacterium sp.]|nr:hypothetical protein [Flavobacterium sp.]